MSLRALYDVPAPAKLNLFLHIIGRRDDGYHLLQSAVQLIDWCDRLHFEHRSDGHLHRHDLGPGLPPDDLCLQAARALRSASGSPLGADISIDKKVPTSAGLGGGSSDAASTLLALNRLWNLCWPRSRLLPIAARLGADVPFFVGGRNAFVEGIGERLTPLALPSQRFAVVKPTADIATQAMFQDPDLARDTTPVIISRFVADAAGLEILATGYGRNNLQAPAAARFPAVMHAIQLLDRRYGNSRMTGSGSAVFARVGSLAKPAVRAPMQELPQGWSGQMCNSLEHHPLVGWASD